MEPWQALAITGVIFALIGFLTWSYDSIVRMERTVLTFIGVPSLALGAMCLIVTPWLAVSW